MMRGSRLVLGLVFAHLATTIGSAATPLQNIRMSRDGAGPSHIFWLTGPGGPFSNRDVIGIVDPLLAAIRLYTVERSTPGVPRLDARLEAVGACALPVDFRPWRILQRKDAVYLEGMPKTTKDGQNTNLADFRTTQITISRALVSSEARPALRSAGDTIDTISWDPSKAISCGASNEGTAGRSAPFKAARGINRPNRTIILTTTADALSGPGALSVRAQSGDLNYLYAVKELEPAGDLRVVHITEGVPTKDGMVRFNQRLLTFGKNGTKPIGEIKFDDTLFRSKIGQRPLAVLPTGEVLAMGKLGDGTVFETSFRVQSCGFVGPTTVVNPTLCSNESDAVLARQDADATPAPHPALPAGHNDPSKGASTSGETARTIFDRVTKLASSSWEVDASKLPEVCRRADGCAVTGQKYSFVAIKGIRLTRGPYTKAGLPYAQTETLKDYDRFTTEGSQDRFTSALHDVLSKQDMLPGNLADNFEGDVGIDCSALLQIAWNGRPPNTYGRLSTIQLQKNDVGYRCPARLPGASYLKSGDAIGISVEGGAEHVVLYGAMVRFDGASEFWLVLESSSSCDGVCWSAYDPSFFNGWGLYRASNRSDQPCLAPSAATLVSASPLPSTLTKWREKAVERK